MSDALGALLEGVQTIVGQERVRTGLVPRLEAEAAGEDRGGQLVVAAAATLLNRSVQHAQAPSPELGEDTRLLRDLKPARPLFLQHGDADGGVNDFGLAEAVQKARWLGQ